MDELVRFVLLGLSLGSLYSLAAQGLVLIYRGSGVLNFGHAALGMIGAYLYYELNIVRGFSFATALVIALAVAGLFGVAVHYLIMRPLATASPLVRLVATLALLLGAEAVAAIRYGDLVVPVESALPKHRITLFGDVVITTDRLILIGLVLVMSLLLWGMYRFTKFGRSTTAVAENQRASATMGLSPDFIAAANWGLGSMLAAVAAILIMPIATLSVSTINNLMLAAMAAALVGGFRSFPVTMAAGLVIGVVETVLFRYTDVTGLSSSVPFFCIVLILVVRGRGIPLRNFFLAALPSAGTGRIKWGLLGTGLAAVTLIVLTQDPRWSDAFITTFAVATVILSVVVLTGYAGQLSLAQWSIAGLGAYFAGRLVATQDMPFFLAFGVAVVATSLAGVLIGLPALRTRGVNLAIITFGLGAAVESMLFNNLKLTGGYGGTRITSPSIFGLDLGATLHPERYAIFCMSVFTLVVLCVALIRRGRWGRQMLAVRTNERAAAALGISVSSVKLRAFALSSGIAAVGGVLISFRSSSIVYQEFNSQTSILLVGLAVIGGVGWLGGSFLGAVMFSGALAPFLVSQLWSGLEDYVHVITAAILILVVVTNPDGLAREIARKDSTGVVGGIWGDILHPARTLGRQGAFYKRLVVRVFPATARFLDKPELGLYDRLTFEQPAADVDRPVQARLVIDDVTVRYGAVVAVDSLSFTVEPGRVLGLIGPNGAGKTTVIDAITGFAPIANGSVSLAECDITKAPAFQRARSGLSRSFQGLELFEDMTVLDNLRAGLVPHEFAERAGSLLRPDRESVPAVITAAIRGFKLEDVLDRQVKDLPYGQRRLIAIARSVAMNPSVLLLDEPAAGLSEIETTELVEVVKFIAASGTGVLLIEHDVNFVMSVCDEIVVLDFGKKIAHGEPPIVRADPKVIEAYLGTPEHELAGA